MAVISIRGADKAKILAALYNASRPQGLGFLHYDPNPMTVEEAEEIGPGRYFDYVRGRVMKIDLSGDEVDTRLYDRDNGEGSAALAIQSVFLAGDTNSPEIQATHTLGKLTAAEAAQALMQKPTTFRSGVVELGLDDVADELGPAVRKALE